MAANVCVTSHGDRLVVAFGHRDAVARYRFRYALAGMATLALASVAPCVANAQASGPVSVGGAAKPLTIGVQERTTYDSDVARGSREAATLRGLGSDDVLYAPTLTVHYASAVG